MNLVVKVALQLLRDSLLLGLSGSLMLYNLLNHNHEAGFFCNDQSLMYPFKPSTISSTAVVVISILLPLVTFSCLETLHSKTNSGLVSRIYSTFFHYYLGLSGCSSLMWIPKYFNGGLRPYFFEACRPVMPDNTTCDDPVNHHRFIEDYSCSATDNLSHNVYRTFPSGHATITTFAMTYLVVFIHRQTPPRASIVMARTLVQFFCICFALYVGLSRIHDHHHHPVDVLAGFFLGASCSVLFQLKVAAVLRDVRDKEKDVI